MDDVLGATSTETLHIKHGLTEGEKGYCCRVAKFYLKVGSRRTTKIKSGRPHHYFGRPHFVTLSYVCGTTTSPHTAVFIGKRKIT